MKNFSQKLQNDPAEREKFINFMHGREEALKHGSAAIADKLNPHFMALIKEFAEQEGFELDDTPEAKEGCAKICQKAAENMQEELLKQFASASH